MFWPATPSDTIGNFGSSPPVASFSLFVSEMLKGGSPESSEGLTEALVVKAAMRSIELVLKKFASSGSKNSLNESPYRSRLRYAIHSTTASGGAMPSQDVSGV